MMYNQKLVASIKANGKILREFKDSVYVPFSSEYSILLKNLNTKRALVNVFIDGENVVPGGLVLDAGKEIDLERSIKDNNLTAGNKFKFIERTTQIEKHRGIKLEDGIVRIEYQFEMVFNFAFNNPPPFGGPRPSVWGSSGDVYTKGMLQNSTGDTPTYGAASVYHSSASLNAVATNTTSTSITRSFTNDAGITVAGSKSDQKFTTVNAFPLEPEKHSIVLKLLGETEENTPVRVPVTVKHKQKCTTCGHLNKANAKFCNTCGTALLIYA
jgi:hypothetical protein